MGTTTETSTSRLQRKYVKKVSFDKGSLPMRRHLKHRSISALWIVLLILLVGQTQRTDAATSSVVFVSIAFDPNSVPERAANGFAEDVLKTVVTPLLREGASVVIDVETLKKYIPQIERSPSSCIFADKWWPSSNTVSYLRGCIKEGALLASTNLPTSVFSIRQLATYAIPLRTQEASNADIFLKYEITGWKSATYGFMRGPLNAADAVMNINIQGGLPVRWEIPANLPNRIGRAEGDIVVDRVFALWFIGTAAKEIANGRIPEAYRPGHGE